MRLLDLFCGRWGWSKAFAARGWECVGIDWRDSSEKHKPNGAQFIWADILNLSWQWLNHDYGLQPLFDFIVASPPCEQFSLFRMKHFHPNPPYPEDGIRLFNHIRVLCEASGVPYVIENVLGAERFVGRAHRHAGPFYLWGTGIPPLLPKGLIKGLRIGGHVKNWHEKTHEERQQIRKSIPNLSRLVSSKQTPVSATIPIELANCVADYAERLLEQKRLTGTNG